MHRVLLITSSTATTTTTTAKEASRRLLTFPSSASASALPKRSSTTFNRVCKTNNYLRSRRPHTTFTCNARIPRQHAARVAKQQPKQQQNKSTLAMDSNGASSSTSSSSSSNSSSSSSFSISPRQHYAQHTQPTQPTQKLTRQQIKSLFLSAAIPMVGFGFMDNFVMITAGSAIDNSLGVQMGLATMTAAAIGQVVSDVSGVIFGDTLSRVFKLPPAHLTSAQRKLAVVSRLRLAGAVIGVIVGCTLGATALYLIPNDRDNDNENNNNNGMMIENASSTSSSSSSSSQNKQQIVRIREQLYRLQKVLNDVMTNKEDKWCDRQARCTLYVNDSMSNSIPKSQSESQRPFFGAAQQTTTTTTATIDRLRDAKTKGDSAAIMQSAKEARVVVFTNTIYVPVIAGGGGADDDDDDNNKNKNILGVLKVELENGSFYSGSEIKDAKRVARNLGFFMNHMM